MQLVFRRPAVAASYESVCAMVSVLLAPPVDRRRGQIISRREFLDADAVLKVLLHDFEFKAAAAFTIGTHECILLYVLVRYMR
jgi:hypothetical protein